MANRIMLNQTSYHGAGAIAEIANEAKAHGFQKALVCSDPDLIQFGVTGKVTQILDQAGLAYELYSDIKANPTIENVQHGVKAFQDAGEMCIRDSLCPSVAGNHLAVILIQLGRAVRQPDGMRRFL